MGKPEKLDWDISDESGFTFPGTMARLSRMRSGRRRGDQPRSSRGVVVALFVIVVLCIVCLVLGIRS